MRDANAKKRIFSQKRKVPTGAPQPSTSGAPPKEKQNKKKAKKNPLMKRNVCAWYVLSLTPIAGPRKYVLSAGNGLTKIARLASQGHTFVRTATHVTLSDVKGLL